MDCTGLGTVLVTVVGPRPSDRSAKAGRPGVGHVVGTTAKHVAIGIRAEFYDAGGSLVFEDEFHWGNEELEDTACSFTFPLPDGGHVDVTVYGMLTP